MKLIPSVVVPVVLFVGLANLLSPVAAAEEGVAVAILYDTSGSMGEPVKDAAGKPSPKFRIADRALVAITSRIQTFATNGAAGSPRNIRAGLFVFKEGGPFVALPFGPFSAAAFTKWGNEFALPSGGTPLGDTLKVAGNAVLNSGLTRKHVLVITDGMNTIGADPAVTLAQLLRDAEKKETSVGVHFVAFDVDAKVFAGVKKLGATVVSASDETQLNTQLEFILEKKILLEDEEPPKSK